jgi:hypothetical protein
MMPRGDGMDNEKLARFLLTFFLGWLGSLIINHTTLKPRGFTSRTLAYLFLGIFGKYVGPIGCFDPVFGRFSFGNTKKDPNAYTYDIKSISDKITFSGEPVKNNIKYSFCPGCGFKLSDGDKYCPGCGREL